MNYFIVYLCPYLWQKPANTFRKSLEATEFVPQLNIVKTWKKGKLNLLVYSCIAKPCLHMFHRRNLIYYCTHKLHSLVYPFFSTKIWFIAVHMYYMTFYIPLWQTWFKEYLYPVTNPRGHVGVWYICYQQWCCSVPVPVCSV